MPNSDEIRRLSAKWKTGTGWPQRLDWIEIDGVRGWTGQRFELRYPIMAVVGENGVGKSSVIQSAAAVYSAPAGSPKKGRFASDFFPDTTWEQILNATIRYYIRQGQKATNATIRKPGERWRGNPERPERHVEYIDLSRIQPVSARTGYTKLVKSHHEEVSAETFVKTRLDRFSRIMGRTYDLAKMALTNVDAKRTVPVLGHQGMTYSGFHQGAGEITVAELLQVDFPQNALILIDEVESSLHPRAQRRLIRELAERCREKELQIVLTTHSPYILDELPPEARAYIMQLGTTRTIIYGVSPEFAMTNMDDVLHPECDLYVEDERGKTLLTELLIKHAPNAIQRCRLIAFGAASVGQALGQMVDKKRFPKPSRVFLDGDQAQSVGCINLPGDDAPERVVFASLKARDWQGLAERLGRPYPAVSDACDRAMVSGDHHDWVQEAAARLIIGGDVLWQAMCAEWADKLPSEYVEGIATAVGDALIGLGPESIQRHPITNFQDAPISSTIAPKRLF